MVFIGILVGLIILVLLVVVHELIMDRHFLGGF